MHVVERYSKIINNKSLTQIIVPYICKHIAKYLSFKNLIPSPHATKNLALTFFTPFGISQKY